MAGVLRINALYRDTRLTHLRPNPRLGLITSFLIGMIFASGWTPCIGPILGAILGLGLQQGTVVQGMLLLTAYSLGLGVPFLIAGYALEWAARTIRRLNRHAHAVEVASGGLMVAMGLLVMFNVMTWIASYASRLGFTGVCAGSGALGRVSRGVRPPAMSASAVRRRASASPSRGLGGHGDRAARQVQDAQGHAGKGFADDLDRRPPHRRARRPAPSRRR